MKTFLTMLGLVAVVTAAIWAYRVNYATQAAMADVDRLQREIASEREAIAVLRAEWAYLNRPERLLALSEKNFAALRLMPLDASHYSDPLKVTYPAPEDPLLADLINAAVRQVQEDSQ